MKQQRPQGSDTGHHSSAKHAKTNPRTEETSMDTGFDSAAVYQKLFDITPEGVMILDAQTGQIVDVNASLTQMLNCTRREFLNRTYTDILSIEDISSFREAIGNLRAQKHICHAHVPLKTKDGKDLHVTFDCHLFESEGREYVRCGIREKEDASLKNKAAEDFKAAEEKLRKSEEIYRLAFSSISDIVFTVDHDLHITYMTPSVKKFLGYSPDELIGRRVDELPVFTPQTRDKAIENITQVFVGETITHAVFEFFAKDGNLIYCEITASPIRKNGSVTGMIAVARDITRRKKMEEDIIASEKKYRMIVENSQEGIFQASPHNRKVTLNHAFAAILGYGSTQEAERSITNIPKQVYVNSDEYQKVLDVVLRDGGIKGYETEFYRKDKSRIWVNMSVSAVRDTSGNLLYYHGIVEDITIKKKLEHERQESINSLRRSLGATINAMSATVEARDPYTAGHQRRVADLARAIATEMKLSRDQIDGIRLAGMIHDIGKISVPSEILTKPTRLTNLEFELIKTHSEAGFNILKDIDFPWPLARIVLEHHERINGTGYPQELKGENILLESKIIAVADVVEAISSNRPYRPAFGLEPALEEVAKNSGILYDKDVAEACLKLFRENRYKMPF